MSLRWLVNFLCWQLAFIYGVAPCEHHSIQELIKTSPVILKALGARIFAETQTQQNTSSVITLSPETLYKGASYLKVAHTADSGEYFEYEGQLNATLEPLGCFDNNILSLLPMKLIAFGKLDSDQPDILRVSINGLHKWSPQFESHIWKYLGWDDWSDFTPCSISCGKGVQQRFRRCLLDSPMGSESLSIQASVDSQDEFHARIQLNTKSNNRNHKKSTASSKMKKRRKKKGKGLATLSCEGYNIEQRNCNMFECKDDISDLLKFYKKSFTLNETISTVGTVSAGIGSLPSESSSGYVEVTGAAATAGGMLIATVPAQMVGETLSQTHLQTDGRKNSKIYQHKWKNSSNFTLMMTLRAKSKGYWTIFSLRNETHNLYLEQGLDGLKLFQERDDLTEMLPITLDLYDNRWHQIAISVHNGDFITVYIDCLWTNSYVVSKGLFSLPERAAIEVGRSFNGDIQQLLLIPGNYERLQCSMQRTPINEVKRYIIDTFIDDDSTMD